jgi:hypothetical protein
LLAPSNAWYFSAPSIVYAKSGEPKDILHALSGWWLTYPSEKYEFVSWDDYSQYMGK